MTDFKCYTENTDLLADLSCAEFYITIVNNQLNLNLSKLPKGVSTFNLGELKSRTDFKTFQNSKNKLNNNDFIVEIDSSIKLNQPIYINHIIDNNYKNNDNINIAYHIKEYSEISLIEKVYVANKSCSKKPIITNLTSFWKIDKNVQLYHYEFSPADLHEGSALTKKLNLEQRQNSEVSFYTFYLNNNKIHNNINIQLDEPGAKCNLFSISMLFNAGCVENNIIVNHNSPECESRQIYKGVYNDKSIGKFNSTVYVAKDAQKTFSKQQNNNILLSDYSSVSSDPQLEIYADDVKCEHGSTIGQIDPKALFYLQSRGLNEKLASNMLLNAFLSEVINQINDANIKSTVLLAVNKRL
ncbi:MAG: hypothetical protein CMP49_00520 [Flavobacteriales bacterium]|nr:hypothetical protein [Flavobacteriales bacterium]|tara:strand:+ start:31684 stop:32748 length:1065 start_codon:yes stop_codon:yes gene_type:complete